MRTLGVSSRARDLGLTVDLADPGLAGEVVARLREHGAAFVPDALDEVKELRREFDDLFERERVPPEALSDRGKNLSRRYGETRTGKHLKLDRDKSLTAAAPKLAAAFAAGWMREVSAGYLGSPHTLNRHVILTHDFRGSELVIPYHFDETRSLKFFLYLQDVDADNAPLEIVPGSHVACERIRQAEWLRSDDYGQIRNHVLDEFSEEFVYAQFGRFKALLQMQGVSLTGPAGSMVVFDTDLLHRGGRLLDGRVRRVARGSTYSGLWP